VPVVACQKVGTPSAEAMVIMKTTIKSLLIGGSLLTATSAFAEIEAELYTGYHSIYEFRGVDLGDDLVDVGLDLNYELAEGLSLNGGVWYASWDEPGAEGDELDLYFGLTKTLGDYDISVGYTNYIYPGASDANTDEVSVGVSTEFACGLGLALTYIKDLDLVEEGYLEFEAAKSFELSDSIVVDVAAGAAWSFNYSDETAEAGGDSLSGFNHFYISAALPYELKEDVTLTPYIKFVGADDDFANASEASDGNDDLFYAGVSLSVAF
jgi:hypothetical protein